MAWNTNLFCSLFFLLQMCSKPLTKHDPFFIVLIKTQTANLVKFSQVGLLKNLRVGIQFTLPQKKRCTFPFKGEIMDWFFQRNSGLSAKLWRKLQNLWKFQLITCLLAEKTAKSCHSIFTRMSNPSTFGVVTATTSLATEFVSRHQTRNLTDDSCMNRFSDSIVQTILLRREFLKIVYTISSCNASHQVSFYNNLFHFSIYQSITL